MDLLFENAIPVIGIFMCVFGLILFWTKTGVFKFFGLMMMIAGILLFLYKLVFFAAVG